MTVRRAMLLLSAGYFFSCAAAFATEPQSATKEPPKNSHEHRAKVEALSKNKHSSGPVIPPKAHLQQPVPAHGGSANRTATASNARHRGANPAIIGGPTGSHTGHTAALSGTHVGRRP